MRRKGKRGVPDIDRWWGKNPLGIVIDGDEVLCDVYARDVNYRDRWIDDDGHLFIEIYGLSQFDPETVIVKLIALLPA